MYIFYSLLFLVSFVVWKGALNENIYIKEFAFVAMIIVAIIQSVKHGKIQICITWGDVFTAGLNISCILLPGLKSIVRQSNFHRLEEALYISPYIMPTTYILLQAIRFG
jgi:hypothetical protein